MSRRRDQRVTLGLAPGATFDHMAAELKRWPALFYKAEPDVEPNPALWVVTDLQAANNVEFVKDDGWRANGYADLRRAVERAVRDDGTPKRVGLLQEAWQRDLKTGKRTGVEMVNVIVADADHAEVWFATLTRKPTVVGEWEPADSKGPMLDALVAGCHSRQGAFHL